MSKPNAVLDEPLTLGQGAIARGTGCGGKALVPLSFVVGLVCAVFFSPVTITYSEAEDPAIDMFGAQLGNPSRVKPAPESMSCPRPGLAMPINAMQGTLQRSGMPSSPLEKFALTYYASTRDVSMKAQAKEEFLNLDPETQGKLKNLAKEVVVRAESVSPQDMAGVTAPMGFFDPLGLSKGNLAVYRYAELKHGRICMLATLGIIVTEKFHPIFDQWGDGTFVSAVGSHFTPTAMKNFWPAFFLLTGFHEFLFEFDGPQTKLLTGKDKWERSGDFGFDPFGIKPTDPAALKEMQTKELNNGRLAMLAAAGILAQEAVTGTKIF